MHQEINVNSEVLSPTQVLAFAHAHPNLIGVKKETLPDLNGFFYSLNYTEEANSRPAADWHPITIMCRGLVIYQPEHGEASFALIPCPKFFNWPKGAELPEKVTFRRKVDGSCIHAVVVAVPELQWLVGTRNSVLSHQAKVAASMLPSPRAEHVGLTMMMELIDPDSDPHETDAAVGMRGLRLLHVWQNRQKVPFSKLHEIVPLLGDHVSLVPQDVMSREAFLSVFDDLENASTRDEVREGFVVEDLDGQLFKYKSYTWLKWSELRIVNERNVLKMIQKVMTTKGKLRPRTKEAIFDLVQQHFPHLTSEVPTHVMGRWKWATILESEKSQLSMLTQKFFERAEALWESGLRDAALAVTVAVGDANHALERRLLFQIPEAKPYAAVAMASLGKATTQITITDFINAARENHNIADSLVLLFSQLNSDE